MISACLDIVSPLVTAAETTRRKTPLKAFRLFGWGEVPTTKGPLMFDREGAARVMAFYESYTASRDGWLDIDVAHLSQGEAPDPKAHQSAGRFRLDLRDDGLWTRDVTYVPEFYEAVAEERFRSYSPVVEFDEERRIIAVLQLALTNIPAMHGATPLALSAAVALSEGVTSADQQAPPEKEPIQNQPAPRKAPPLGSTRMRFNPMIMAMLCLSASATTSTAMLEADPEMMADKPGMEKLFRALVDAVAEGAPGCHLEEVYEDHVILGCPYEAGVVGEKYMKMPYSVEGGAVRLGEGIAVTKKFIPATGAMAAPEKEGTMSASARVSEVERMLLDATGTRSVSAAITRIEQLKQSGGPEVVKRLENLETQSLSARRTVLLDAAKRAGKWTASLESLADKTAARAKKLGEDPISAMQELFDAAPVVVAPGSETQLQTLSAGSQDGVLTAEERQICEEQARAKGVSVEVYQKAYLDNRRRFGRVGR